MDAVNYSEIATVSVDKCVLDLATESTDSCIGLITMDDQDLFSAARIYDVGRRKPTDDDSDPDDDAESDEEEEVEEDDTLLNPGVSEDSEVDSDFDVDDNNDEYDAFGLGDGNNNGILDVISEGEDDYEDENGDGDDSDGNEPLSSDDDVWF